VIKAIKPYVRSFKNRSEFIEAALWLYVKQQARHAQNRRDLEILNRRADSLNVEAADVLEYQVEVLP
jgi:Arc/MetJ-type ribon-helix-helix transcriptional regulator